MDRLIRYQGAIIKADQLLLLKALEHDSGHEYWLIPGGGRENGESEEDCIRREMKEETNLDVQVERLLFFSRTPSADEYPWMKTYLCTVTGGKPKPGYEPEAVNSISLIDLCWIDLKNQKTWDEKILSDPITYPIVQKIRITLGYIKSPKSFSEGEQ